MGWLKADAPANIASMSVTLLTSQLPMDWLKADTPRNMAHMSVTLLVSQLEMSSLNVFILKNNEFILVIDDVHHLPIG